MVGQYEEEIPFSKYGGSQFLRIPNILTRLLGMDEKFFEENTTLCKYDARKQSFTYKIIPKVKK